MCDIRKQSRREEPAKYNALNVIQDWIKKTVLVRRKAAQKSAMLCAEGGADLHDSASTHIALWLHN